MFMNTASEWYYIGYGIQIGLQSLQDSVKSAGGKIINELVTLPTPGKADVQVVILADPDDHEICFVGDEGFRALSKVDESAEKELREQIKKM
uniref:Glyoxalase domain-containing protein 4 n=2 Tax=Caenorhabditis japonica TaxID=281687 RepID=A0A8R1IL95_CAEJA